MKYLLPMCLLLCIPEANGQSFVVSGGRQSILISGAGAEPVAEISTQVVPQPQTEVEQLRQELIALKAQIAGPDETAASGKPVLRIWTTSNCHPCSKMKAEIQRGCFGGCLLAWEKAALPPGVAGYPAIRYTDKNGVEQTHVGWTSGDAVLIRADLGLPPLKQSMEPQEIAVTSRDAVPTYRSQWPPRWNVEGVWNASRDFYLSHLRTNPNHRNKFWQAWPLESWSREQLAALHDDDHVGKVSRAGSTASSTEYQTVSRPVARAVSRTVSTCPGGRCPSPSYGTVRRSCPNGMCPTYR